MKDGHAAQNPRRLSKDLHPQGGSGGFSLSFPAGRLRQSPSKPAEIISTPTTLYIHLLRFKTPMRFSVSTKSVTIHAST